jgi:hypothetical protein
VKSWARLAPVLFAGVQLAAAAAPAVRVRIEVVGRETAAPPLPVALLLQAAAATPGGEAPELTFAATAPGETVITLPAAGAWRVRGAVAGFWSESAVVTADGHSEALARLRLFPAGTLRGTLATAKSNAIPTELELRWQSAPGLPAAAAPPKATERCELEGAAFHCAVPAGRLDLRFRAPAYGAIYRWNADVPAGGALNVGVLQLQPGASVVGWVTGEDGRAPAAPAQLRLARQHLRQGLAPATEERLEAMSFETRANERGFFQFQGVPPGVYSVAAVLEGMAPAAVEGIEVRPGLEAEILNPLLLARPVGFEAEIAPPHDPYGQPWRLAMSRHDSEGFPIGEQVAGAVALDGRFTRSGLAPGTYDVRVSGEDGSQWFSAEATVGALEPPLLIRIPLLEVAGTARLGDDALVATLWLGRRDGAQRVRFDTDLKGRFEGHLPRPGRWSVEVVAEDPYLRQTVAPVDVREPEGGGPARVEIVLPDTHLAGEVVDEVGRPLPRASVSLAAGTDRTQATTEDDGEFSLRGLQPGSYQVKATAGERTSGWVRAQVSEEGESPRLRLVAAKALELAGTVLSPAGPVPGAQVMAWPDVGTAGRSTGLDAVTDPLGRFRLTLPASTSALNVIVFPPGNALRMLRVPVAAGRPLEIAVQPSGATLVLEPPADMSGATAEWQLAHGGIFIALEDLLRWARLAGASRPAGGAFVLPEMQPGDYIACRGSVPVAFWNPVAGVPSPPGCATGTLAPYSTLTLRPDAAGATGAPQ